MTPRAADSYFTTRIAPDAPSPSGARVLIDDQTEGALRAVAGEAMAAGDAPIISWALDECVGRDLLGHCWRVGETLDAQACARLAEWLRSEDRPYGVGPREIIVFGVILAGIAADPQCVRDAHADAAGRVYSDAMRSWREILERHPGMSIGATTAYANHVQWGEWPDIVRADYREIKRLREMVPGPCPLAGDLHDALEDLQVEVEAGAAALRRGEWMPVDRHLVTYDWCRTQMRAMHRVVKAAVRDMDTCPRADSQEQIATRLARLLELLGHVRLAERILANWRAARMLGALLAAYVKSPGAEQNIYGLMCAVEERGAWGVIAEEYSARLPGALSRRDAHDDARDSLLYLRAVGSHAFWAGEVEAMLAHDRLARDTAGRLAGLPGEVMSALDPIELHAAAVVDVMHLEAFLGWAASDDAFLGWGMHFEPVRTRVDVVRPCLVFSIGAMIDGRLASASAIFPLPGEVASPTTIHDARVLMDEALARAGVTQLAGVTLHPRPAGSVLDADWHCVSLGPIVNRPSVRALLGLPDCDHRAGEWSAPRSGMPQWTPEAVPSDAMALGCRECDGPFSDVVPRHRIIGEQIDDPTTYLARENFYRAVRGEDPVVSLDALWDQEPQNLVLTPHGARPSLQLALEGMPVVDMAESMFG